MKSLGWVTSTFQSTSRNLDAVVLKSRTRSVQRERSNRRTTRQPRCSSLWLLSFSSCGSQRWPFRSWQPIRSPAWLRPSLKELPSLLFFTTCASSTSSSIFSSISLLIRSFEENAFNCLSPSNNYRKYRKLQSDSFSLYEFSLIENASEFRVISNHQM